MASASLGATKTRPSWTTAGFRSRSLAVAETIGLLPRIGRHPEGRARLRLERDHGAQVGLIVEGRPVEREQPMVEVARRGHPPNCIPIPMPKKLSPSGEAVPR